MNPTESNDSHHQSPKKSSFSSVFKKLDLNQKISLILLLTLLAIIPIAILVTISPVKPTITPATGPVTPPTEPPPGTNLNVPVIITSTLPQARTGKNYRANIEIYDLDRQDNLTVEFSDIPEGLTQGNCVSNSRYLRLVGQRVSYINCTLSGRITASGEYLIGVTASDGLNSNFRSFAIKVSN